MPFEPDAAGGGNTGGGRFVPDSDAAASEGGAGSDLLKSLKAGAQKLPGQITGLLDIPAALTSGDRPISRAADWVGEKTGFQPGKWARDTKFSPGYDASRAAVDETWKPVEAVAADPNTSKADVVRAFADNLPQILKGYGANPMYSLNQVAESLPGMVAGGVLSRGLMTAGRAAGAGTGALEGVAGKWAAPIAGGVGEGAQQAGQVMDEFQGQDQRKAAIAALASGGLDALIAAGGGRVANRLGLETPETAMAKLGDRVGSKSAGAALGAGAKVAGGAVSEGVFQELPQSMQEQAWQNWAEGKPIGEGVLRGGIEGGIAGGMMGTGANVSLPRAGKAAASPAAGAAEPVPAADVVGSAEPSDAEKALTAAPTPLRPERIAATEGAPTTFSTEAGSRLEGRYALVEAGEVQASHDTDLRPNPAFPPELQPRDRTRAASEAQIQNIVGRIDPARLGLSADAGTGAPIIGEDGLVESGNARTIALQRVYGANGQKAHEYRSWLRDNAATFGLTPDQVEGMRQPMLVRVRTTPVDRAEFARQANASTVAAMSPLEQARADAARIDSMDDLRPDEQGDFGTSRDFIRRFVGRLPQTEQAGMIDAGGRLSASGYARVRNAVLAKAYGDSPVLARMVESMDDNLRNVSRALMMAAPRVAQVRSQVEAGRLHAADLTPDLVAAVTELERIKQRGGSVADALAQRGLDGEKHTPVQRELLQFLDENIRRPRRIAEFIGAYADALEAAGHPGQGSLLADAAPPTVPDLLAAAKRETASQAETAPAAAAPATASQPNPAAAAANEPEVDGNWRAFGPETGTLGVPRSEMPQVKMKQRPALFDFLQTRGIGHTVTTLDADTLKPTQAEYSEDKTNRAAEITSPEDPRNQVLVSSDGYIIDGHHRWLASARAHGKVNAVQFDAPAGRVLDAMMQFPGTTVSRESAGAVTPSVRDLAVQDLKAAVGELGEFLTRHMRAAFTEEDERRVMPILVKLFDAGIRVVGTDLRKVMAWVRDHLRRNKDVLPGWNKIPATVHRKAAEKALAGLEQRGQQLGLFSETEQAQPDLFSAPPEPSNQVGKPEVATIDGRPYDPARDNYRLPATDSFIPAATLAKARGTVARLAKESTPVEIDAGDSARAEAMLRPLIEKAKADKPAYDQKIIDIAKKIGALGQMLAPVKGIRRAVVKLVTDEKFNVDGMKDMLRSTIVVGSYADAQAAVDAIRDEFGAIMPGRVKNRTDATITAPESDGKGGFQPSGYGDVLVNVRLPSGVVAEIQINVPEMLSAKSEEGHALYEIERSERPGSQAHAAAVAAQAEIYTLASAAAASRAARTTDAGLPTASRKSASEISDQRSGHRAAGDMPAEGSRSSTTNRLPSGNSTYTSSTPSPSFKSMPNRQPSGNLSGTLFASTPEIVPAQASAGESAQPDAGRYNAGDVNPRANPAQGAAGPDAQGSGGHGRRPERAGRGADAGTADAGGLGQPRSDGVRGADADGAAPGARSAHHADGGSPAAGRLIGPKTGRNYRFTADDIPSGSWFRRATRNLEALQLLRRLESEQRKATPDEQRVLAQFSGWGASELANNLFDDKKADVRARALSALQQAKAGLGDKPAIPPRGDGYWPAYDALTRAGTQIRYGDPIPADRITPAAFGLTADAQRWQNLREQLKAAMTPAEWAAAARSTQYAHYTSHAVVRSMWGAMQRFGFAGGTIFEPGAGNGIFPGLMPVEMATNSAYTGVEFDPVTGGILKQLQPDEKILVESFVDTRLPRDFFDVAIGNPPFSGTKIIADPDYKKHAFALHDYFFAKTLDRVRPGGLLAFVTSRYTMDKAGDKARQFMAERADLIGAIRLPQTAFKANAGTDVVTDVLFLRKKDGSPFEQAQPWLKAVPVETKDGPAVVNEYFAAHPEMVLGTPALAGTMYSKNEYTVLPPAGDIEALFAAAVERLPADVYSTRRGTADEAARVREIDYNPKAKKEGNYYLSDKGMLMQREGGIGRAVELKSTAQAALIKSFIPLRDALKQAQYDQLNGGDWEASLQALQAAYRKFVKAHGQVNQSVTKLRKVKVAELDDNGMPTGRKIDDEQEQRTYPILAAIADDPDWTLVAALEKVNDETGAIAESSFLKGRVLGTREQPRIETPQDALLASLNEVGKVDIERIAHLAHVSVADVQRELVGAIYLDPVGNRWVTADEYLSGNVKQKLADARAAAAVDHQFDGNVKALEDAQPAPLTPAQINVAIGMNWIPGSDYAKFLRETAGVRAAVEWQPTTKTWNVTELSGGHTPAATADWGTLDRNATELLAHALTGRAVRITRSIDIGGTKKTIPDAVATEAANEKLKQLQEAFSRWLWSDAERTDRLVREYNDRFNTTVPRAFDGRHLTLPGVSTQFHIFDHVKRGAWRIIQSGNTYLAHAVGSGKTFQCVIAAMEMRRLGIASKPMVVVPNHMLQQFAREWQELYPAARLMIADEQNFHTDNRRRFVSRAALSDLDGIVITHSAFKLLDIDPEFKQKIVQRELDILEAALEEAEEEDGKRSVRVKQIQRQIENLQQKLDAAMSAAGKDKNARFDELGVDFLFVDEAHEFRKLDFATARQVKGIQPQGSARALDLYVKTRWLEEKRPGRSLVMMSGTPITNTVAELYTVQKFMDFGTLERRGLDDFDSWAAMFGRERTELEPNAAGVYEPVTRFSDFVNVPELTQMFRNFADVVTADELAALLGDKRPKVEGGARQIVVTPKSAAYEKYQRSLASRVEASRKWKPTKEEPANPDPLIRIIGDGRLAAIDMRFVQPGLPNDPDSKLNRLADDVIAAFKAGADVEFLDKAGKVEPARGDTMMVFSDLGFGEGVAASRGFNARAWFEKRLRDAGVPMAQVAFMSDHKKSTDKAKLFKDVNAGRVRILVGSSKNMGTGVNAQQRLKHLFHLDSPWYPADLEQREGRAVRQGNKNKTVRLMAYATKGTYDENMWKMLATKQLFIDKAMSGDTTVREIEDLSSQSQYDLAAAMVAEDPRVIQLAGAKADVEKLNRLYQAHEEQRQTFRDRFRNASLTVEMGEQALASLEANAAKVQDLSGDNFKATADGKTFTERAKWGEALIERFKALLAGMADSQKVGEISGFPVWYRALRDEKTYRGGVVLELPDGFGRLLVADDLTSPMSAAMQAAGALTEVARAPQRQREAIASARNTMDAVRPRLDSAFPMLDQLTEKRAEVRRLEAELAAAGKQVWRVERADGTGFDVTAKDADAAIAQAVATNGGTAADWKAAKVEQPPAAQPDAGGTLLSTATGRGGSMDAAELLTIAVRIARALPGLPPVEVLRSPAEAPEALRQFIESRGANGTAEGALHDGQIYLFADNLASAERAEFVLAEHEAAHAGLRGLLGRSVDATMRVLYDRNPRLKAQADKLVARGMPLAEAVEEVIVDIPSAELAQLSGWRRVVQLVRDALSRAGLVKLAGRMDRWLSGSLTEQQRADMMVADLVREARAFVAGRDRAGKDGAVPQQSHAPVMSRSANPGAPAFDAGSASVIADFRNDVPLKAHADYKAAKAGDVKAAANVVRDLVNPASIEAARNAFGPDVIYVAPHAEEASGRNKIPNMLSAWYAAKAGGAVDDQIIQTNRAFHTGANAMERLIARAEFAGDVQPGKRYVLVDDVTTMGSTLADLAAYIRARGGEVVGSIVLVNAMRDGRMVADAKLLRTLEERHGDTIREQFGFDPAALTAEEARYLLGFRTADELRGRVAAARQARVDRLGAKGVRQGAEGGLTRLSRDAALPASGASSAAERAESIIQTAASTPKPLDAAARTLTRITGLSRLTAATYGLGARLIERITPETVKAGIVSDYGVPEAVLDRRALLQGKMREELRKSGALLEKLATLTRAESRVAYEWMSGDDTRTADEIMKDLPEESVQVLRQVRTMIDQLSQEAVRLGQLEPEAFERHRFAYLRRSYFKHAQEFTPAQRAQREHAIKILGDQYKGRGMVAKAPMKQVQNIAPDWWKRKMVDGKADTSLRGEKFERLERRAPTGAGTLPLDGVDQNKRPGRLLEIHYWPAGEPRPAKYADWESAGTWEVRDTKGGDLVLWRDFTKDERTKMGEIDEARYAIGKTLQRMIHDVEVGRYLEWLEQNHAKKPGEMFHGTIVEPSERYSATFPPGTWVQVPDTTVPGTSVKRFGKLAGLYLPGPVWNDLRQTVGGPTKPLGEAYHQAQRIWKTSKTALSPAVHTNNVMANFVMADWHDVTAGHVAKALRLILAARTGDGKGLLGRAGNAAGRVAGANDVDAAREILARYEVSGGSLGGWVTAEISREQLAPIVEALQAEVQGAAAATAGGADVGVYAALQHLLHGRFARSFEAAKGSKPVAAAVNEGGNLLDLYQAEDDVFRLAAWLRAKEDGASDADAGKVARKSFLDYSINAPWIAALRATALPFVSFSYRAIPMLAQTVAHKPHKILKLMAIAGALNALGVMIGGGGGDDERKLLPEEKAGGVWGLVPKLVRMPWNDSNGSPVYLDIRRWIPVGDVFDIGQGHAALPLPPSLMPGGPMAILGELLLNRSAFTGKPITLDTDTGMEKAGKVLDHLWKALMPNILGLPGTYATQSVVDAAKGRTDAFGREQSVPQAVASSVGVKLGSYPSDVLQRNLQARAKAQIAEIDDQIRQLKRQRLTNRIDQDEFEDAVRRQQEKKRAVMEDLREKID